MRIEVVRKISVQFLYYSPIQDQILQMIPDLGQQSKDPARQGTKVVSAFRTKAILAG